ncbi:MAG: hypothetical protein A3J49_17975 [Gallionellales bacterium RIFCSPHIGHO2_02_FULL_57_16]|nr:MAG: hypothetical protein A3J49_17975 [Gallionellales bacterium RIFCSPHIGHO2_02_FULL_57_16]
MSEFPTQRLDEFIADGSVLLGRGDVISKDDIEAHPGPYPIYSSSAHNNGKFGEYGKFMFDEELITWSVDGGGYFFYRPKHKYSVTNVCGYMRLRGEKLHPKFVYYSLVNQHRYLTFDYTSKAHPSVIKKQYWLPTIAREQQQKIAAILTCVDTSIEKTEALIAKYQQIKAGLMHDLFTRGVTADGKLRPPREQAPELYQETPIGWIPKEWEVAELKSEIGIAHGFAFSGEYFSDTPPGEVLLTPGNFHRDGGLYFTVENTKYFQGPIPPATVLPNGEMVTVMTDLSPQTLILGRFAIVETPFFLLHNQRIGRVMLKRKDRWDWSYLCYALNDERVRRKIIVEATGTTVRHTSPLRILGNRVARPHLEEQRRSIEVIRSIERRLVEEQASLLKSKQEKLGLMTDLLTGQVRVKGS